MTVEGFKQSWNNSNSDNDSIKWFKQDIIRRSD